MAVPSPVSCGHSSYCSPLSNRSFSNYENIQTRKKPPIAQPRLTLIQSQRAKTTDDVALRKKRSCLKRRPSSLSDLPKEKQRGSVRFSSPHQQQKKNTPTRPRRQLEYLEVSNAVDYRCPVIQHPYGPLITFLADDLKTRRDSHSSEDTGYLSPDSEDEGWIHEDDEGKTSYRSSDYCGDYITLQAITDVDAARECLEKNPDERNEDDIEVLLEFLQNLPVSCLNCIIPFWDFTIKFM